MNKGLLSIVAVIIVLTGGGLAYLMTRDKPTTSQPAASPTNVTPEKVEEKSGQPTATGAYVNYDENKLANTEGTRILFFYAPWCPQCRALEASIKESVIPDGVTIFKVDYDANQQLRKKYGVTIQTTLVKIDTRGNLVEKYVAYDDPNFQAVKENLL